MLQLSILQGWKIGIASRRGERKSAASPVQLPIDRAFFSACRHDFPGTFFHTKYGGEARERAFPIVVPTRVSNPRLNENLIHRTHGRRLVELLVVYFCILYFSFPFRYFWWDEFSRAVQTMARRNPLFTGKRQSPRIDNVQFPPVNRFQNLPGVWSN